MEEHGPCQECGKPGVMGFYKYPTPLQEEQRWALCREHLREALGHATQGSPVVYDESSEMKPIEVEG